MAVLEGIPKDMTPGDFPPTLVEGPFTVTREDGTPLSVAMRLEWVREHDGSFVWRWFDGARFHYLPGDDLDLVAADGGKVTIWTPDDAPDEPRVFRPLRAEDADLLVPRPKAVTTQGLANRIRREWADLLPPT